MMRPLFTANSEESSHGVENLWLSQADNNNRSAMGAESKGNRPLIPLPLRARQDILNVAVHRICQRLTPGSVKLERARAVLQ